MKDSLSLFYALSNSFYYYMWTLDSNYEYEQAHTTKLSVFIFSFFKILTARAAGLAVLEIFYGFKWNNSPHLVFPRRAFKFHINVRNAINNFIHSPNGICGNLMQLRPYDRNSKNNWIESISIYTLILVWFLTVLLYDRKDYNGTTSMWIHH